MLIRAEQHRRLMQNDTVARKSDVQQVSPEQRQFRYSARRRTYLFTCLVDQTLRFDSNGRAAWRKGDDPFPDLNRLFGARRLH